MNPFTYGTPEFEVWERRDAEEKEPPRLGATPASAVVLKRVRWGWQDRMPVGELTLIPGREGVGKSLLLAWLAAQLTSGTLPGEYQGSPRSVLYVASEDSWAYTVAPRMKAAGADLDRVFRVDVADGGRVYLPADCDGVADLALEVKAAAIMLDPIVSLIDDKLNVNQSRELRQALEPLRRAAERAEVIVPALAHFNKTTDTDVLSKIPGARAWAEVARAAFGVAADEENRCYVASQIKNNLGRLDLPSLTYTITGVQVDTDDGPTNVGKLEWGPESDTDVSEVLSRKPERRARDTSDTTKDVIGYVLEAGYPVAVADVYTAFPDIPRNTIRQVLKRAHDRGTLSNPVYGHYGPGTAR